MASKRVSQAALLAGTPPLAWYELDQTCVLALYGKVFSITTRMSALATVTT
jgi:hypothetical protein